MRVAAYTGLRLGELLALRWRDVEILSSVLTISRAMSAGIETATKSGRVRRVAARNPCARVGIRVSEPGR